MNWAWASSLDEIWRSPTFPMWLTLAAAGFFGLIVLITLLRAERSVANGALAVITLLSIAVAGAATVHGFVGGDRAASAEARPVYSTTAALPQLSCIDDLAGDAVLTACEKALFGSAEAAAAAVAYAASQVTLLTQVWFPRPKRVQSSRKRSHQADIVCDAEPSMSCPMAPESGTGRIVIANQ